MLEIESGYTLKATNVRINNSNPAKLLQIDGTFEIVNELDFNDKNIEIDGSGTIKAGTIVEAGNVECTTDETPAPVDCPMIISPNPCDPAGQGLCGENVVMPVQLIFFAIGAETDHVALNWATASEKDFDYFSIQRSYNGKDFSEIGRVTGKGTTQERQDYTFQDRFPSIGTSYYRLVSVDFDGYSKSFDVEVVTFDGPKSARIFPNPAVGTKPKLEFSFTPTEDLTITITDLTGIVKRQFVSNQSQMELDLPGGTYLVKIASPDFHQVIRCVIN